MLLSRARIAASRHARRLHFCRPAHTSAPPPAAAPAGVDFDDVSKSFKSKSTWELARSLVIFKLCTFKPLVTHSKQLLALSNSVFGQTLTSAVIKHSFFAHFCAGEDERSLQPVLTRLRAAGIGGILDFAAEADVDATAAAPPPTAASSSSAATASTPTTPPSEQRVVAASGAACGGTSSSSSPSSSSSSAAAPFSTAASASAAAAPPRASATGVSASTAAGLGAAPSVLVSGSPSSSSSSATGDSPPQVYDATERELDGNLQVICHSLSAARGGGGFTAVKVTGLAQPELLQHVSNMLHDHRRAFRRFDIGTGTGSGTGSSPQPHNPYTSLRVMPAEFVRILRGPRISEQDALDLFTAIDAKGDGAIDYHEWCDFMSLLRLGGLEARAAAAHAMRGADPRHILSLLVPAAAVDLSPVEQARLKHVLRRSDTLAAAARAAGVTIMVDAEQTYLQPAIDYFTLAMMRKHNRPHAGAWLPPETTHVLQRTHATLAAMTGGSSGGAASGRSGGHAAAWPYNPPATWARRNDRRALEQEQGAVGSTAAGSSSGTGGDVAYPVVYNTYQAYLKDTPSRLALDMARARDEGFLFGAKLVRGAYMHQERALAAEAGYKSPIHDTLADTHACYHACADALLGGIATGTCEAIFATHNEASITHVTTKMAALGIDPQSGGVSFGQLLGMCDHISYALGTRGYKAYKYLPYGPVQEVIPYLLRRAQENSDVLGGVGKEIRLYSQELKRRLMA